MTKTMGPMEDATWRHGCEIHPNDRETFINTIQACLGLWLALLEPIASPNSLNGGFKWCNSVIAKTSNDINVCA